MKIKVRGYLTLKAVIGDQPFREIEDGSSTVKELIRQLSLELGDDLGETISNPKAEGSGRYLVVLVNGRHCSHLPDGLDTELADGDEVAVFPPVAGG
jgi:MoaD family protein